MFLVTIEPREFRMQVGPETQSARAFSSACQAASQDSLVYT